MTTPPDGFRHHMPLMIRYADMDTLGHVNNAKYLTYIEQARVGYFHELKLWDGRPGELGLIVAKITMEYKLALAMADGFADVWSRVCRLGNRSFEMEHLILRSGDSALAGAGQVVMVVYNYETSATVPIPDDWRARIIAYEPALAG